MVVATLTSFGGCAKVVGLESEYEAAPEACVPAKWPLRPETSDAGDDIELVFAWRSVDFGEGDLSEGPKVGYDLDGVCTCHGDEGSCLTPEFATADTCDGPGGRDNSTARLFGIIRSVAPDTNSERTSANIESGEWSLLIRVRGYNGKPNDDQVELSLYPSDGLDDDPCGTSSAEPRWDGNDRWPVPRLALLGGEGGGGGGGGGGVDPDCSGERDEELDHPRFRDDAAYVREGVVVGALPDAGLTIVDGGGPLSIVLSQGFLSGRIQRDGDDWRMTEGLLVGRWALSDVLAIAPRFRVDGDPVCTDHSVYALFKNAVCSVADITAGVSGPTTECDAMSFGIAFEAEEALLGTVFDTPPPDPNPCPPEIDPGRDSCAAQ